MRSHIVLLLSLTLLLGVLVSCHEALMDDNLPSHTEYTYSMTFDGNCAHFDDNQTRSAHEWAQDEVIYLHFMENGKRINGRAVYDADNALWTVTSTAQLQETEEGVCMAVFIQNPASTTGDKVQLSAQSVVYRDNQASYSLQDGEIKAYGLLTPQTGRIQFRGVANSEFSVSGLSFMTEYAIATDQFSSSPAKFTARTLADGCSEYYYATFADEEKRELMFTLSSSVALQRAFGETVLRTGESGYITIPTLDTHDGWTLVDPNSSAELSLPSLSAVTLSSVNGTSASFAATVTHTGNSTLTAAGFVVSRNPNPTLVDMHVSCTVSTSFGGRVGGLLLSTTYYVRAYATNALGTTYSAQQTFTTLAEDMGNDIGRDEFEPDQDLNDVQRTDANVKHEVFGTDEDWN